MARTRRRPSACRKARTLPRFRLRLDPLEDRLAPAIFTVNSTGDDNTRDFVLTLREALLLANGSLQVTELTEPELVQVDLAGSPVRDTINFNIPGSGVQIIEVGSTEVETDPLPVITDAVLIDGYSQPGASRNTSGSSNAVLLIELTGADALFPGFNGLEIARGASNVTITGLVVNRFANGIVLPAMSGHEIEGNFIGTNAAGAAAEPNTDAGIRVVPNLFAEPGAPANRIGGFDREERNLISGNGGDGVVLASGDQLINNLIGANAADTAALANGGNGVFVLPSGSSVPSEGMAAAGDNSLRLNRIRYNSGHGILVQDSPNNFLEDNEITQNLGAGVYLAGLGSTGNLLDGNHIGTGFFGSEQLGNGQSGVVIDNAPGNSILGEGDIFSNRIAFNAGDGVRIIGSNATGNTVLGNRIYSNGGLAIDLGPDGPTPNDAGDADLGPNNLQNAPELISVARDGVVVTIQYRVPSTTANSAYPLTVQFFASGGSIPGDLLFSDTCTAEESGQIKTVSFNSTAGQILATATDAEGNTSEYSSFAPLQVNPVTLTTSEDGCASGGVIIVVSLLSPPSADVTISVRSSDPSEVTVTPTTLTFTPGGPLRAELQPCGVDDGEADGDVPFTIFLDPIISDDPNLAGLDPPDVTGINIDNEAQAGVLITPLGGLVTTESGDTASFTVVLTSRPTDDVTIELRSSDASEGILSSFPSLRFTPEDALTPRTVTITGVDDPHDDGDIGYIIELMPASSNDARYQGIDPSDVAVTNLDNEQGDLKVNIEILERSVQPKDRFTYEVTATNLGAPGTFTVTVQLPPKDLVNVGRIEVPPGVRVRQEGQLVTFRRVSLDTGESIVFTIQATARRRSGGASLTAVATITGAGRNPGTTSLSIDVAKRLELRVDGPAEYAVNPFFEAFLARPSMEYSITVFNANVAPATDVTFSMDIFGVDHDLTRVIGAASFTVVDNSGGSDVTCLLGTLAPGEEVSFRIQVTPTGDPGDRITAFAAVTGTVAGQDVVQSVTATTQIRQGAVEWLFLGGLGLLAGQKWLERRRRRKRNDPPPVDLFEELVDEDEPDTTEPGWKPALRTGAC